MQDKKLTKERREEIDGIVQKLPLIIPFYDNDLCELRVRPEAVFRHFHYDCPEEEFDYWQDVFSEQLRVVHLENFCNWLRGQGVEDRIIAMIPKESPDCKMQEEDEAAEIAIFDFISGKINERRSE